jgi:hypothetical protein
VAVAQVDLSKSRSFFCYHTRARLDRDAAAVGLLREVRGYCGALPHERPVADCAGPSNLCPNSTAEPACRRREVHPHLPVAARRDPPHQSGGRDAFRLQRRLHPPGGRVAERRGFRPVLRGLCVYRRPPTQQPIAEQRGCLHDPQLPLPHRSIFQPIFSG